MTNRSRKLRSPHLKKKRTKMTWKSSNPHSPRHNHRHKHRHHHHRHKRRRTRSASPTPSNPFEPPPLDPETAFRESLFDALADDEGAAYWEGVYGQPIHIYGSQKPGPDGELERMDDDEYAAFADGYHAPRRLQCGDLNAT